MSSPLNSSLNSPLEVGVRVLIVLVEAFPAYLDLNRLALLDYGLLHSADLGGPESLQPPVPIRVGEFGVKRQRIHNSLQVMIRARLAEMSLECTGFEFRASENSENFLNLLESKYVRTLRNRAKWVVREFGNVDDGHLRERMKEICFYWSEEHELI